MALPGAAAAPLLSATGFRASAAALLSSRLVQLRSPEAATLRLRPSLQALQQDLLGLMEAAVLHGQNVSLLLIAEPGVGATTVLERALSRLMEQHGGEAANPAIGVVRLSGALHCDERAAFMEVARQLCSAFRVPFSKGVSYGDNLSFLKDMLAELHRAVKMVVFVVDEVHAFLRASKQTLLYNLLDALTSSQVNAAVFGVSPQHDVMEAMEKRVRSRFSSRRLLVPPLDASQAAESVPGVLKEMLQLPDGFQPLAKAQGYNASVARALGDAAVGAALQQCTDIGITPRELAAIARAAIASWEADNNSAQHMTAAVVLGALHGFLGSLDSKVEAVAGLSVLELAVLVAARKVEERGAPVVNFEMVFEELSRLRHEHLALQPRRGAAWRAFSDVVAVGLVQHCGARVEARGLTQQFAGTQLLVTPGELERGLERHPACPDVLKRWLRDEQVALAAC